jgi:predicted DNA-binding transcriptional regulator YafY
MQRTQRLLIMLDRINKGRCPNIQDFCRDFEIKERTAYADINCLREQMGFKIEFDHYKGGYISTEKTQQLPKFELTEGELLALTLGKDMLTEYSGTIFEPILTTALEKITERLSDKVRIDLAEMTGIVHFKTSGVATTSRKVFLDLNRACENSQVVEMNYFSAHSGQLSLKRQIEPYRLVESRGAWYVIAWCRLKNELRQFAVHRIKEHKVLAEKFEQRANVNVDNYLADAFVLEQGEPPRKYVIKFDPVAARYITERNWHTSQELVLHPDGSCTLSFTATRLDEIKRWVLVYGASAEVLEPAELRDVLREELSLALKLYESKIASIVQETAAPKVAAKTAKRRTGTKVYKELPEGGQQQIPIVADGNTP